jgi:hypothetical protein
MNAKDTVVGTAKKLVAEIVGDGGLAEEGARQAGGLPPTGSPPISDSVGSADPAQGNRRRRAKTLLPKRCSRTRSGLRRF